MAWTTNCFAKVHGGVYAEDKMKIIKDTSDAFKWPSILIGHKSACANKDAFTPCSMEVKLFLD